MTRAYECLWVIGDDFCYFTIQQYFKEAKIDHGMKHALYAFNTFEVTEFVSSKYKSHNKSPLGHLLNNLMYALNTCKTNLLKLIVVAMDDDTAKNVKSKDVEIQLPMLTEWIVHEFEKAVTCFKEQLPDKAKGWATLTSFGYVLQHINTLVQATIRRESAKQPVWKQQLK